MIGSVAVGPFAFGPFAVGPFAFGSVAVAPFAGEVMGQRYVAQDRVIDCAMLGVSAIKAFV